jgi:transposase-like protein
MKYDDATRENILNFLQAGISSRSIAEILGISKSGVNDFIAGLKKKATQVHTFGEITQPVKKKKIKPRKLKVLFFDLENAPSVVVAFQRFNVNLSPDHILEEGGWLLSAAWSWGHSNAVHGAVLTPAEALARDDSRIVAELYEQIEQADIVVAHHGDNFDVPLFKTRCLKNGFNPPKILKTVDTVKMARRLKFNSNKLDSIGNYLEAGRKVKHSGISLWVDCMNAVPSALKNMLTYNKQDVRLLKEVYYDMLPFDNRHPNVGQFYDDGEVHCPSCGGTDLSITGNVVSTNVSQYTELVCGDCGHRSRTRKAINSKEHRKLQLSS